MKANEVWKIRPLADPAAVVAGKGYRITVLTDRLLRLEYEPDGVFCDSATQLALNREFPVPAFTVRESGNWLTVETESLRLAYDRRPFAPGGLSVTLKHVPPFCSGVWHFGDREGNLGGTARTLDRADGAIPLEDGIQSRSGCAVLDDSRSMRMDADGNLLPAAPRGMDLYFFGYGHDFKACVRDFLRLSGPVPAVPRFALGNWWSRYYRYSQQEYQDLMTRFREEGIPLSVAVLDMDWHRTDVGPEYGTGWTGYSWDRAVLPEPEKLLAWLHDHGLKVTLNDHPADGIRPCEDVYPAMAAAMGDDPAEGRSYSYDAADGRYRTAFEKTVLDSLEASGVDFWWIDWQQKGGTSDPGMDPLFTLNHCRYLHALEKGFPALILSRYGGPGSHRYPVGFSGDTCVTWASLAFQPFFTASAANIAYSWWSHDIGGHMHGAMDPELSLRWLQFGVFSPVLRLHSTRNDFMRKEPWTFPPEKAEIMKEFLRLRHRLIPWLYTQNLLTAENGEMLLRPLYYDYPDLPGAFSAKNEYLLGDCLLVCPVTEPVLREAGAASAGVVLPEGVWTDFFTGARYRGGCSLKMYRPLDRIPVLVREGSVIPMDACPLPLNGAPLPEKILLRVFPGADAEVWLTEDNGKLPADPEYLRVHTGILLREDGGLTVEILPPEGAVSLLPENRRFVVELNGFENRMPDDSSAVLSSSYDPARRALTLELAESASGGAVLKWTPRPGTPEPDRSGGLKELLLRAEIPFDLKTEIALAAADLASPVAALARLHCMSVPDALTGEILELLYAE